MPKIYHIREVGLWWEWQQRGTKYWCGILLVMLLLDESKQLTTNSSRWYKCHDSQAKHPIFLLSQKLDCAYRKTRKIKTENESKKWISNEREKNTGAETGDGARYIDSKTLLPTYSPSRSDLNTQPYIVCLFYDSAGLLQIKCSSYYRSCVDVTCRSVTVCDWSISAGFDSGIQCQSLCRYQLPSLLQTVQPTAWRDIRMYSGG